MTQQIIDVGANANDGTGEPLRNAFTAVNDNFTQIWNAGPVGTNVQIVGNVVTTSVTNLGLTLAANGVGNITANSTIVPGTSGVYDLGAPNNTFQYIYGDYLVGNGALITGIVANTSYNNANVAAFLPTYTGNLVSLTGPVRTTANVIAGNIITSGFLGVSGNIAGGNITGNNLISSGYVTAVGNITTTANISGNYILGNGAFLTGVTATNIAASALTGTTLSSNVTLSSLQVVGNLLYVNVNGNVTTTGRFIGSGAGLTNIPAANIVGQVSNALTAGTVTASAQPNITSLGTLTSVTATGNVSGNYFIGNGSLLTGIVASNVNAGALIGDTLSSNVLYSSLKVVDDLLYLDVLGNITTTGRFIGSGAGLTNIPAANITGAVANATYATTAGTAYSVAGANVTGTVANATYAITAGSATTATYANTANAVSGANVSGPVANATYATTAGSATTATTAATVSNAAQPNITSVGTLTSVSVAGNATSGNVLTGGQISAVGNVSGNYFIGNGALLTGITANASVNANALVGATLSSNVLYSTLQLVGNLQYVNVDGNVTTAGRFIGSGAGLSNIPGANVSGAVATATNAGTVTTAAQPNITSVGTLTSLTSTGNVTANYFIGNGSLLTGLTASNVNAGALVGSTLSSNVVNSSLQVVGNLQYLNVNGNVTTAGRFIGSGAGLTNITGANVTGTVANATYANTAGTATTANSATTAATVTANAQPNITSVGTLTSVSVTGNAGVGRLNIGQANLYLTNTNPPVLTIQADATEFSSNIAVVNNIGTYSLTANGTISAFGNVTGGNLVTAGNATASYFIGNGRQLTGIIASEVSTLANLSVTGNTTTGNLLTSGSISATGNVTSNYFIGNGALLTGVTVAAGTQIVNGSSNVSVNANGNVTVGVTGTGNLAVFDPTGVVVAGQVSATGNVSGSYIIGNGAFLTGLGATYGNSDVANYLPTYTGNLVSLTGPVTTTSNVTGGNILTGGLISATGNVVGDYILGNGALLTGVITSVANINNGTSNITVVSSGGNITVGVGGTSNVVQWATTGEYVTGVVSASGNVTGGNVLTDGVVSAAGNVIGNYFIGNGSQLTGVAASSVNAAALVGNTLSSNVLYSSLTTVGTLANLSVTGNVDGGNISTAGLITAAGNITGGNLIATGGTLAFANSSIVQDNPLDLAITGDYQISVKPGGGVYQWTFNNDGSLSGPASSTGYLTLTGNVIGGNLLTDGLVSASGNVTGGNLLTDGLVSATGNLISGNVNTSNIQPVSGALTIGTGSGNLNLQPAGNIVLANTIINSVAYPQQDTDAATKAYVDNMVSTGLAYHEPVVAATTTTLAATTGGTITYTQPNGVANGVGAKLTTTGTFNLIDTANVQTVGTRILVKNEANAVLNGVYTWANATNIVRSLDADEYGPDSTTQLSLNDYFFVSSGNINKGSAYVVSAPVGTITFGTSNIDFSQFSSSQTYTANTNAGLSLVGTEFNARVDNNTTAFDGGGNIIVKAGANLTTPNIGAATGTSLSLTGNVDSGNVLTSGVISATANITGGNVLTGGLISATANIVGGNLLTAGLISATSTITSAANITGGNITTAGLITATGNIAGGNVLTGGTISAAGNITGNYILGNISQSTGGLGNNINMGSNTQGAFISNAVTLTTTTTVTNGIALLNQVLGKLVPPAPPNFPNSTTITLSGISTYRMANITQVDNTPGANRAVAAGTTVANVLRVATYATNTIANVGPGDAGTIVAVRNGANVGSVTLNAGASPSGNGTYGSNLVISNNFDYNSANANIAAGFWYVFTSRVSGTAAPAGWNELYIADTATANTNTTVWYYDNSSPSAPSFSSTTMTPPGTANVLYSSTIPHYTNNNNFTISFNVANISGNTYPTSNTLASGSSGGAFLAPASINYSASNIGSNILPSFASASANTTVGVTSGFGGSATGPIMTVNNSYSTGTLTLTTALGNIVLYKSGNATAIDEGNVVIGSTIGTGSGNAYRIINPGTGNTPTYTGSEAAFNSQSSTLQTYDATVVGSGSSGVLKHDQTNYSTGYLPAGPNLSSGRTGTQYFTMKFVRTAVSKFDIKYTGNIAGMWVALPGSVIDSSSSANGWINMAVAYGGAGYPGVNAPGNGSDGCAVGGTVSLNTSVTNSSKTCTFGTVSSSSTATNEIYVRIALTSGQSVTALTLETASN